MRRERAALGVAAAMLVAVASVAEAQGRPKAANECVACHSGLPVTSQAGHGFVAWRRSGHAAAGVSCAACHGGDPTAADQRAAHQGVAPSSDSTSLTYFTRVPDTCGHCHASEAGYFRSSVHYVRLRSDGRGPNCVTCHGAMATSVLSPNDMLGTCSACHGGGVAPVAEAREAARVLALLRAESRLLDVVTTEAGARRATVGAARTRRLLDEAGRQLAAAAEVWHEFRLDSTAARLDAADSSITAAWMALGHPAPREAPPFAKPRK